MKTFSALLALCEGNPPENRWISFTKASEAELWFFFSLICAGINGCTSNQDGGDLRRHRTPYDVTVMWYQSWYIPDVVFQYKGADELHWNAKVVMVLTVVMSGVASDNKVDIVITRGFQCYHADEICIQLSYKIISWNLPFKKIRCDADYCCVRISGATSDNKVGILTNLMSQ